MPTKYRVLRGIHSEGGKVYEKGSIVESKSNLLNLNSTGSTKFKKVSSDSLEPEHKDRDTLSSFTVPELREMAESEEIEVDSTWKKDQLISALLDHQE